MTRYLPSLQPCPSLLNVLYKPLHVNNLHIFPEKKLIIHKSLLYISLLLI